ncbi:mechanosensitive ion channel domain-containing protein [Seonamhaeicola marinus]|uniref:Mechanosensitive ion channel family protein n=1 Tax=Seonamhaeicola marinus TaxID=1912246 RepID=A0A5D0HWN2_9FLAO|nr:mechanosensitive ion channel family protein [Seonamhaeicola marinus]TYA74929.1 mechanosensitive ion channel family protein [Seonamhaeicola marinus]
MELKFKAVYLAILLITVFVIAIFTKKAIIKFSLIKSIEPNRRKIIIWLAYLFYYFLALLIILLLFGIDTKQFVVFASSVLAVIGIGFFAQWSILSNLSASVILFFFHPLRIGSKIKILDSEINVTGKVLDITGFYTLLKTEDDKTVAIPNSIIINKGMELLS